MSRFFVDNNQIKNNLIAIKGEDAKHLYSVLRSKVNDEITVCDGNKNDYTCKILSINKNEAIVEILSVEKCINEPKINVTLFQSLPKSDKMELIIQKCTEIGIYSIVPVVTENTVLKTNNLNNKLVRYNKIAESASKQCGRGIIPNVSDVCSFKDALKLIKNYNHSFVCYEKEENNFLKDSLKNIEGKNICYFIGPEGGFSDEEINLLKNENIKSVSLGKRILRTETAGMFFLSILLYELGEF